MNPEILTKEIISRLEACDARNLTEGDTYRVIQLAMLHNISGVLSVIMEQNNLILGMINKQPVELAKIGGDPE